MRPLEVWVLVLVIVGSLLLFFMLAGCTEPDRTAHDAECVQFCAQYPPNTALEFGCVCEGGKPWRSSSGFPYTPERPLREPPCVEGTTHCKPSPTLPTAVSPDVLRGFCASATDCATDYADNAMAYEACEELRTHCERTPGIGGTE